MASHSLESESLVRGRKLPQYLVVYLGACAGLLQFFDLAIERVGLSDRYFTLALIVCLLAFPVVVGAALISELKGKDRAARRRTTRRRVMGWSALLLFVLLAAVAAPRAAAHFAPDPQHAGTAAVLLTALQSRTGDSAIAAVATDALALDFEQDASLALIATEHATQALALDGVIVTGAFTRDLARRAAARVGAAGYVTGEIARAGDRYLLIGELYNGAGERITATRVTTANEAGIWAALDDVSAQLRAAARTLPLATVARAEALTHSGEAIARYADAVRALRAGERAAAEAALRTALQHDPTFVPALRALGELLYERADSAGGRPLLTAAHEGAASLHGRERFLAFAAYYQHVQQNAATAVVNYRRMLELDPADSVARARIAQLKTQ